MSSSKYTEADFELSIVNYLTSSAGGWIRADDSAFRNSDALDSDSLVKFVKSTQSKNWLNLVKKCGDSDPADDLRKSFIESVNLLGLIYVIHNGFTCRDIKFKAVYFAPESNLNPDLRANYEKNICQCVSQWHYSAKNNNSIDIMLAINGIPLAALELKNQFTHQDINNAVSQWQNDRDPREPAFSKNKRVLAFFAVDLNDVRIATQLDGAETKFLPFNQGTNGAGLDGGAGNPEKENGCITSYLWEDVLQRDKFLEILQRFIHYYKDKENKTEYIIFPRYHQLDVVRKIAAHVRQNGAGHNYLIQHSAGSGKSNSIAWTAYRLSSLHNSRDEAIFNSVIVITDRRVLDRQLRDTLTNFEYVPGVLAKIEGSSQDLKDAINSGKRIIITTLQKFPHVYNQLNDMTGKRFALIIDEAHSSQTGEEAHKMKEGLTDFSGEDFINREIKALGRQKNLSCFAFTATPKAETLEIFGVKDSEGNYKPFHIYSMRQAIEEKFIIDVLKHYTAYKTCYEIAKTTADSPKFESSRAMRIIRNYAELHEQNITAKTEIIIETFMEVTREKIDGQGKLMLVTPSRLSAVRYYKAMNNYCDKKKYDVKIYIAFSGKVIDPADNKKYTESGMNHFSESQTKKIFHKDGNILIVADKYQTGFDEPLLHTMIIDKELHGIKAVQTLSRLNRTFKHKDDTFIIDFVNDPDDIQSAFQKFYTSAELVKSSDPDYIYKLRDKLREFNIYSESEINEVIKIDSSDNYKEEDKPKLISRVLTPSQDKYNLLSSKDRREFRKLIHEFVKVYNYFAHIINIPDENLLNEYKFCYFLSGFLPVDKASNLNIAELITLVNYGVKKFFDGDLTLTSNGTSTTEIKESHITSPEPSINSIDDIIRVFNEKFSGDFTDPEREIIKGFYQYIIHDKAIIRAATQSDEDEYLYNTKIFPKIFDAAKVEIYKANSKAYEKIMSNSEKYDSMKNFLKAGIYKELRNRTA